MLGQMMQGPLLISSILVHAERHHPEREIVSRRVEGDIHRTTYRELASRARRLAKALAALGVERGDRVGSLAWNGHRHLELYYAVSGAGSVLHTLNPRLNPDHIVYMIDHADDQVLFFDLTFLPIALAVAPRVKSVRHWVALCDRAHLPPDAAKIPGLLCYEDLLASHDDAFEWPTFDENLASSLCYTSGTTGHPKGVLYSHRSTLLHSLACAAPDVFGCSANDVILPVVPMFHVNAWGLPYVACMVGAKLVFPGPGLDGKSLYELFESEKVTLSAGVPTVWQNLITYVRENGLRFTTMKRTLIGGSACPPSMSRIFGDELGVHVVHAWGMTETSPVGTACTFKPQHATATPDERYSLMKKQGRALFGVDMKIVDDAKKEIPFGSEEAGDLLVRGPWIIRSYFGESESALRDGWFPTGDVATIDADGYMHITDRTKDVIKSGGEWISSIDLENIAMAHPHVAMAACIAAKHPKWDERPLLVVVKRPDASLTREELLGFYEGKLPKWQIPDDVVFVDAIPVGATGKMLKTRLREQFANHVLPSAGRLR